MCIESLFKEEPTTLQVEALEPSFVYALPKADLERIALHNVNIQNDVSKDLRREFDYFSGTC